MLRKRTLLFTLLAVGACSTAPAEPAPTPTADPDFAKPIPDADGLSHVAQITPYLYRGAQPTTQGYRTLKRMGIKTVISFRRFNSSQKDAEAAGLDYVAIPIYASVGSKPPGPRQVELFFETTLDAARQPVYIHCKHGKDRTGTMAALFRIERQGWSNARAIEEMQAFGYHDIFDDLIDYVRDYEPRGF